MQNSKFTALMLLVAVVTLYGARIVGPSVLQRFDQPKTVAYTADVVLHGNWLLPRDMRGDPARKPPLVNWLAAPVVAMGFWTEWAVKLPMLLASLVTLGAVFWYGRLVLLDAENPTSAGLVAAMAWLVNPANVTFVYHCRPDAVLVCSMTIAWIAGTLALQRPREAATVPALIFWLSVGIGLLAKGPPALVPVLYVPLAARWIHGKWAVSGRIGWKWGPWLAAGIALAYYAPLALFHPEHFREVLIKQEVLAPLLGMGSRFGNEDMPDGGPVLILTTLHQTPAWFLERFAPWSVAALAALVAIPPRSWSSHKLAPAILWMLLVLACFSLLARKTADYILPAYPAAAILASWFLLVKLRQWKLTPERVAVGVVVLAAGLAIDSMFFSSTARKPHGENLREFALEARRRTDGGHIWCVETGFNTLEFFLHQNDAQDPGPEDVARAEWFILPVQPSLEPVLVSGDVPSLNRRIQLALYSGETVRNGLADSVIDRQVADDLSGGRD